MLKNLCVAEAFSESCDVIMCVALEAVCLYLLSVNWGDIRETRERTDTILPPA